MPNQLGMDYEREELSLEERLVLRLLRPGRMSAQPVAVLAEAVGVTPRNLQEIVRHLINEHGEPIGSATSSPTGYYYISDAQEVEEVYQTLRHRAICILQRAARLKKASIVTVFGQGEL